VKSLQLTLPALCALIFALLSACGDDGTANHVVKVENLYDDSISTSYTTALPDAKGEGLRITYTFFNMKRSDTGNFKMTHVYMRHTGEEDTTIVNGTWKLLNTDSGKYVRTWSGRSQNTFRYEGEWSLMTLNTDSMIADTGLLHFRQKKDNDMRNSTVHAFGKVMFTGDNNASFLTADGDTIPILKISAFRELLELKDSVDLNSASVKGVEVIGTFQIRMAMDGRSIQRSLIVEEVGEVR
jgi:hypothetical protein